MPDHEAPDGEFEVSATVANTGELAGGEDVQLYARDAEASVTASRSWAPDAHRPGGVIC